MIEASKAPAGVVAWVVVVCALGACLGGEDGRIEGAEDDIGTVVLASIGAECDYDYECGSGEVCCANGADKRCAECCYLDTNRGCPSYYRCATPCGYDWYRAGCCPGITPKHYCPRFGTCHSTATDCYNACTTK